ncbi:MAG: prepilin peptidase [Sphingomonadaceae bacterium]|uniref:A24 family peptidase n=1 Tax=Thermaurantiacus sp. TaxID=2820283 RepID=UPI00298F3952|nr:prepilin peptidase [Thermaurantiacus sp.]MCS6987733.1 prepilin peptidase [Sphingomonadaceae bacterium]MDW8415047.1 prepilin peptidase [Thermaurantiacus sp.]
MEGNAGSVAAPAGAVLLAASTALAAALLVIAAAWDLAVRQIPDRASAGIALAALVPLAQQPLPTGLASLLVATVLFGLGVVAFRFGLMGGGDVKLLGAVGLWLRPEDLSLFLAVQAVTTLTLVVLVLLWHRRMRRRDGQADAAAVPRPTLPFGVAIAAGGIGVLMVHVDHLAPV